MMNNSFTNASSAAADEQGARSKMRGSSTENSLSSVQNLLGNLWRQSAVLVQQEVALAKAEVGEKATRAATCAGAIAVGGAVLFGGFILLLLAAASALAPLLPPDIGAWLALAIVGLAVVALGFVMVSAGLKSLQFKNLAPSRSIDSLQRDAKMVKEHV